MLIAKRVGTNFDVLGVEETSASILRNKDSIQLSWINEAGQLERYRKISPMTLTSGSLLRLSGSCLMATGDKSSAVAMLLGDVNESAQTKVIDGKTAYLLPVLVL